MPPRSRWSRDGTCTPQGAPIRPLFSTDGGRRRHVAASLQTSRLHGRSNDPTKTARSLARHDAGYVYLTRRGRTRSSTRFFGRPSRCPAASPVPARTEPAQRCGLSRIPSERRARGAADAGRRGAVDPHPEAAAERLQLVEQGQTPMVPSGPAPTPARHATGAQHRLKRQSASRSRRPPALRRAFAPATRFCGVQSVTIRVQCNRQHVDTRRPDVR